MAPEAKGIAMMKSWISVHLAAPCLLLLLKTEENGLDMPHFA